MIASLPTAPSSMSPPHPPSPPRLVLRPSGLLSPETTDESPLASLRSRPAWAEVSILALIAEVRELDHSVFRPTELEALYSIERQARALRSSRTLSLPPLYRRLLRLERACLLRFPHLDVDERLEFIAANAHDERGAPLLLPLSPREVLSILDKADEIVAVREALEMTTRISDFTETEARRLYERWYSNALRRARPVRKGKAVRAA